MKYYFKIPNFCCFYQKKNNRATDDRRLRAGKIGRTCQRRAELHQQERTQIQGVRPPTRQP